MDIGRYLVLVNARRASYCLVFRDKDYETNYYIDIYSFIDIVNASSEERESPTSGLARSQD